jgi:trigger factor
MLLHAFDIQADYMKVEKKVIDDLNAEIALTIEQNDYLPGFKNKLNTFQQKSQMKGFRKGKTPIGMLKKMYGASAMQEVVSGILTEEINKLITGDEFNIIGEPLLMDEDNVPIIDHNNPQDYTYHFQLGLEPEFEVKGIDEKDSYALHEIKIEKSMVDEEIENICKRLGEQKSTNAIIQSEDVIYFQAKELEKKAIKVNGFESEFSVNIDKLANKYQKELKKKKLGDNIDFDIYELEPEMSRENVHKYFLKLKEGDNVEEIGSQFRAEIIDVVRVEKAAFDQESFDKYFGEGEVSSEEEAREKIKTYMSDYFAKESQNLLSREIMEALVKKNDIKLPKDFIKKWITRENEITDDQLEGFLKELQWRIIKKKLVARFKIEVKEDEIFGYFVNAIRNYSPYIDEASLKNTAFSLMKNKEQLNTAVETISSGKLFDAIKPVVTIKTKKTSKDDFYKIVKEINQKTN